MRFAVSLCAFALATTITATAQPAPREWTAGLEREVKTLGKPAWRPMLQYDILLHRVDTHPATPPFEYPWEDIGRGYGYGPGTAHWDPIHEILSQLHGTQPAAGDGSHVAIAPEVMYMRIC